MSFIEFVSIATLLSIVWYWVSGMRAKEIAISVGARICKKHGVSFLDESMAKTRMRVRRDAVGHAVFYREYQFEFTSDGAHRYRGKICLLGKQVLSTEMEPYRQDVGMHEPLPSSLEDMQ